MNADIKDIEKLIKSTGFYHNKAKNIKNCAAMLVEKYGGKVPDRLEDLITLPGVGRKTANVVLGMAFGIPGMVVDTHVARISKRLGLTENTDPEKIEQDLMKIIPVSRWNDFSLELILTGRGPCKARKPECDRCFLYEVCDYQKISHKKKVKHTHPHMPGVYKKP
jgi:endonuclease-3